MRKYFDEWVKRCSVTFAEGEGSRVDLAADFGKAVV